MLSYSTVSQRIILGTYKARLASVLEGATGGWGDGLSNSDLDGALEPCFTTVASPVSGLGRRGDSSDSLAEDSEFSTEKRGWDQGPEGRSAGDDEDEHAEDYVEERGVDDDGVAEDDEEDVADAVAWCACSSGDAIEISIDEEGDSSFASNVVID